MSAAPVLIAGEWRPAEAPTGHFSAIDPRTGEAVATSFPISGARDLAAALEAGAQAQIALETVPPGATAAFLETYARKIEANAALLAAIAGRETGLAEAPRLLGVELPRTLIQMRQAAAAARDRSWCRATLDRKNNIRSFHTRLPGPVAIFGPNNFPFAFNGISGGDFVAAIAAGNAVIAKANPGHPETTQRLAELAHQALVESELPKAAVQLLYHLPAELGLELVSHPLVGATAFTGSKGAGLRLKEAADRHGRPIYLEMASNNPIFILPGALRERSAAIAGEFYDSCSLGAGQFCTRPGLAVLLAGERAEEFIAEATSRFRAKPTGVLLGPGGLTNVSHGVQVLREHGAELLTGGSRAEGTGFAFQNTLLRASGDRFLAEREALQTEAFGAVSLIVVAADLEQMLEIAASLQGNLTGAIYSHGGEEDEAAYARLAPVLSRKVGRLLNDKMPTGVAVSPAMNHGGPFPATGHPGFTAVGIPASLLRFTVLRCYDAVRSHRLPPELQDRNPTGTLWRLIDGEPSQADLTG